MFYGGNATLARGKNSKQYPSLADKLRNSNGILHKYLITSHLYDEQCMPKE